MEPPADLFFLSHRPNMVKLCHRVDVSGSSVSEIMRANEGGCGGAPLELDRESVESTMIELDRVKASECCLCMAGRIELDRSSDKPAGNEEASKSSCGRRKRTIESTLNNEAKSVYDIQKIPSF